MNSTTSWLIGWVWSYCVTTVRLPIGERGRVIITDYFNRRSPFIRYEIGDLAVLGACPCGRVRLPALSQVIGKVRGALLHRDGNRIAYVDLLVAIRGTPGLRQHQIIQDGL